VNIIFKNLKHVFPTSKELPNGKFWESWEVLFLLLFLCLLGMMGVWWEGVGGGEGGTNILLWGFHPVRRCFPPQPAVPHIQILGTCLDMWWHFRTGSVFFLISSLTWPMIQERSYFHITLPNKKLTHLFLISSSWQFVITHGMFSPLWLRFFPFSSDHLHISQIIITYHSTSLIKVHLHLCPLISLPINIKNGFCSFFILNLSVHHTWFQTSIYVF
jgi:hypothetical protein